MKKQDNVDFKRLLSNKKLPVLTLDPQWHDLFPNYMKNSKIRGLERKLNNLLKQQGKLVTDAKEMKKIKTRLMDGIITNMGDGRGGADRLRERKQEKSQELILDINDKIRQGDTELMSIPYQIQEVNEELLIECMSICYEKIRSNSKDILEIGIWVARVRGELKDKILEKQDKEMQNEAMYSYMHHILGADTMEVFDRAERQDILKKE